MKKLLVALLALTTIIGLSGCSGANGKKKIGVIQYAEHPALDKSLKGFKAGLKDAGYNSSKVTFDIKNAQGDASNCETIASKFVNDNDDLIFAIATPAAQAVAQKTSDIPIVITAVTDPESSGLVKSNKKTGNNVTGTSDLTPVKLQITLLKQLLPNAKTIGILYCGAEDNSIYQAKLAKKAVEAAGLTYVEKTVSELNQISQVTNSFIGKVDALYIPTDNLLAEGMTTVTQITNENNLPVIAGEAGMVSNGALATKGIDYYKLGYKSGKQAAKILSGKKKPSEMPIEYLADKENTLTINKTVANKLGITIPETLANEATYVE